MTQTIEWHRDCLKNRKVYLDEERAKLERLKSDIDSSARAYNLLAAQIDMAEKEGKKKFDADRYAVTRLVFL